MKSLIYLLFILMLFLHQDSWAWDDQSLVLGFMPVGLAYHAVFPFSAQYLAASQLSMSGPTIWKTLQTVKTDSKIIGYQSVA